ncbi:hypothetical protein [Streptomyces syringium]|uniref:hypothetical protein n=1 Tax=Streptomyces syringium TaxID=76729 RepID=UPI00345611BE
MPRTDLRIRTGTGRCPFPVTLIVDSQPVKAASTVGKGSRGYDPGKKTSDAEKLSNRGQLRLC